MSSRPAEIGTATAMMVRDGDGDGDGDGLGSAGLALGVAARGCWASSGNGQQYITSMVQTCVDKKNGAHALTGIHPHRLQLLWGDAR